MNVNEIYIKEISPYGVKNNSGQEKGFGCHDQLCNYAD